MYRHSDIIDTDQLLAEKLTFAANEDVQPQNCATAALRYALGRLGKDVTDGELARLVSGTDKSTTLYQMKQFAQSKGFYCKVVKADMDTLRNLEDCEIILHIPGKKHFVAVSDISSESIGVVDLAESKFYYRADLDFFSMDWAEGIALIISDGPVGGKFIEVEERELGDITGASGYDCNVLRQEDDDIYCEKVGSECLGAYRTFYERWACGYAESGSCSQSPMIGCEMSPCIQHPQYPTMCSTTVDSIAFYIMACD